MLVIISENEAFVYQNLQFYLLSFDMNPFKVLFTASV